MKCTFLSFTEMYSWSIPVWIANDADKERDRLNMSVSHIYTYAGYLSPIEENESKQMMVARFSVEWKDSQSYQVQNPSNV